MTDPVSTAALRTWAAARADGKLLPLIRAAADEIDRLRADVKASATMHEQARVLADSALKQRDALRAVIEDAPHKCDCSWPWDSDEPNPDGWECTCWKADVR